MFLRNVGVQYIPIRRHKPEEHRCFYLRKKIKCRILFRFLAPKLKVRLRKAVLRTNGVRTDIPVYITYTKRGISWSCIP
jgi:hypothetical protein